MDMEQMKERMANVTAWTQDAGAREGLLILSEQLTLTLEATTRLTGITSGILDRVEALEKQVNPYLPRRGKK